MDQSLRPVVDETRGIYRVPRRAFVDQTVFERECRAIFDKCWLYLGHASELPNPGDYVTRKVAGRPMLFTRDKDDQYHALINVCPHRGAVVCRERKGSSPAFQRSEARRVGTECVSTCRSRWTPDHKKKKNKN